MKDCLLENQVDVAVFAEHDGIDLKALANETGHSYRIARGFEEKYAKEKKREKKLDKVILMASESIQAAIMLSKKRYTLYKVVHERKIYLLPLFVCIKGGLDNEV